MNTMAKKEMHRLFKVYYRGQKGKRVLDVGSLNINGTFKKIVPESWKYIGVDILKGDGVDVVMPGPFEMPFDDNSFDVIISGSCLEHCANPFRLMAEMARVLKKEGHVFITAPYELPQHEEQSTGIILLDCWRFLPNGFDCIFEEAKLRPLHTYLITRRQGRTACWGVAQK